eukprot:scaffold111029_cov70-Phaeocystis_antarctica.AAC.1
MNAAGVEVALGDDVLDAAANCAILEVFLGASLMVGRALVVLVVRVVGLVLEPSVPPGVRHKAHDHRWFVLDELPASEGRVPPHPHVLRDAPKCEPRRVRDHEPGNLHRVHGGRLRRARALLLRRCRRRHATTASRLYFDDRIFSYLPTRKRRLALEFLAPVIERKGVRRHARSVADGIVQDSRGHIQVDVHHDGLALLQLHLHL